VLSIGIGALALLATGVGWIEKLAGPGARVATHAVVSSSEWTTFGTVARLFVGVGIAFALVAGLYWVGLPPSVRKRMPIVPGALLAVALQVAMGFGYGLYLSTTGSGDAYQAGLAVMGVTLMTLYLFSLAVLIGAELNQVLGERRLQRAIVRRQTERDHDREARALA
jgi:membrane protein